MFLSIRVNKVVVVVVLSISTGSGFALIMKGVGNFLGNVYLSWISLNLLNIQWVINKLNSLYILLLHVIQGQRRISCITNSNRDHFFNKDYSWFTREAFYSSKETETVLKLRKCTSQNLFSRMLTFCQKSHRETIEPNTCCGHRKENSEKQHHLPS